MDGIIHIGTVPSDEACAQTGVTADWATLQQLECSVYRAALIGRFGEEPAGACLGLLRQGHDFGSYTELVVKYDTRSEAAASYAETVADGLRRWFDAGFIAPVAYEENSQVRPGTKRTLDECITGTLVRLKLLLADGYGNDRDQTIVLNLEARYPGHAEAAERRTAEIRAELSAQH